MAAPLVYDPATLPLGVLGRPHATRGQVKLRLFHEESRSLSAVKLPLAVTLIRGDGEASTAVLLLARLVSDHYLLAFEGVDDRDKAATLTGALLRVPRSALPPLGPDEFYLQDLVGCRVEDQSHSGLGLLQDVFHNGAHAVGVIAGDDGGELLVPLCKPFLLTVDVDGRLVRLERLPEEDLDDAHLQET